MLDGKNKHLDNYKTIAKNRAPRTPKTFEEKAKARVDQKDADNQMRKDRTKEQWVGLCNALDGEVFQKDGRDYCRYPRYQVMIGGKVDKYDEEISFGQMNADMPVYQYMGMRGETGAEGKAAVNMILAKEKKK